MASETKIAAVWSSGALVFYESAGTQGTTYDVFTMSDVAVKVGTTANDIDFQYYGTGAISAILDCGAATYTLTGITLVQDTSPTLNGGLTMPEGKNIATGTGTGSVIGVSTAQKIGFWAATPVVRQAALTQTYSTASGTHAALTSTALGDSSGGTATAVIGAITGGAGSDSTAARDAIASLTAQVNALRTDITNIKNFTNQVVDEFQTIGLLA